MATKTKEKGTRKQKQVTNKSKTTQPKLYSLTVVEDKDGLHIEDAEQMKRVNQHTFDWKAVDAQTIANKMKTKLK